VVVKLQQLVPFQGKKKNEEIKVIQDVFKGFEELIYINILPNLKSFES